MRLLISRFCALKYRLHYVTPSEKERQSVGLLVAMLQITEIGINDPIHEKIAQNLTLD